MSKPSPPIDVVSSPGNGSITVSWSPPINSGSSEIQQYTITLMPGKKTLVINNGYTNTATFTGLTNGVGYSVSVTATNSSGISAPSGSVVVLNPMIINIGNITGENNIINLPFVLSENDTIRVDWGDSSIDTWSSGQIPTHTYSITGNATIMITGIASVFGDTGFLGYTGNDLILGVRNWGFAFTSLRGAFSGCVNLTFVPSSIPISLTNASAMFLNASSFNQDIKGWDTSSLTDMSYMFSGATAFNIPLNSWNTAAVTDMNNMFSGASAFNQPLDSWNTAAVTDMSSMFKDAIAFNKLIGTWNTSSVRNMSSMFFGASAFNPVYIKKQLRLVDRGELFIFNDPSPNSQICVINDYEFPQLPIGIGYSITGPNVPANTRVVSYSFRKSNYGSLYNSIFIILSNPVNFINAYETIYYSPSGITGLPINSWDTSSVTNMSSMFYGAIEFNQPLNSWNTSNVTNTSSMFRNAIKFNQSINSWNTSLVVNMNSMFLGAREFNQPLNLWKTSSVSNMGAMFYATIKFNQDLSKWNVNNVTNINNMFFLTSAFNQNLRGWRLNRITLTDVTPLRSVIFNYSRILTSQLPIHFATDPDAMVINLDGITAENNVITLPIVLSETGSIIVNWGDNSEPEIFAYEEPVTHTYTITGATAISITGTGAISYGVGSSAPAQGAELITGVFSWGNFEFTSLSGAFNSCTKLEDVPSNIPSTVLDVSYMFNGAEIFNQNISTWNTSNIINMSYMFFSANLFNQPLNSWNTSAVTNMSGMFNSGISGTSAFNQELYLWDTSAVTNMSQMFAGTSSFNRSLNSWNTGNVTNMRSMFSYAVAFNQPLNSWDTSSVTNMRSMFSNATIFNQALNFWNTSAVTDMRNMFQDAAAFNQPLNSWNTSSVTNMSNMFENASAFNGTINSWNTSAVTTMSNMFKDAIKFNNALNSWNTSAVEIMDSMFENATVFNQPLNLWNTSAVTEISVMFYDASAFNQNISNWDMGSVQGQTNEIFTNCPILELNKPNFNVGAMLINLGGITAENNVIELPIYLSGGEGINESVTVYWGDSTSDVYSSSDESSVKNHTYAITGTARISIVGTATRFGTGDDEHEGFDLITSITSWGNLGFTSLDGALANCTNLVRVPSDIPSSVTDIGYLFYNAEKFNQDIGTWNTSNITRMRNMFEGATAFNRPLNSWNTSNVTRMENMFKGASAFNQLLNSWNTSAVTNMRDMFYNAVKFNQDINSWNTSAVTEMQGMFQNTIRFNQPLNSWDTSLVNNMEAMFKGAFAFNQPLNSWNTSSVTNMTDMFYDAVTFNEPLNSWNTSAVITTNQMFYNATAFNKNISSWNTISITNNTDMFTNCPITNLNKPRFDSSAMIIKLEGISAENNIIDLPFLLSGSDSITVDWGDSSTDTYTDGQAPNHTYAITGTAIISINGTAHEYGGFGRPYTGKSLIVECSSWGNLGITSLKGAFVGCNNLVVVPTYIPNIVVDVSYMFSNARLFNQDISSWNTSNITNMTYMFNAAVVFNKPLNSWDTSSVTDMSYMFTAAYLFNQPLNLWNTSSVTTMRGMFTSAKVFNQPLNSWNTSSVIFMQSMFQDAYKFNQPLNLWNISSLRFTNSMFQTALAFNQNLTSWNMRLVPSKANMFLGATKMFASNKPPGT